MHHIKIYLLLITVITLSACGSKEEAPEIEVAGDTSPTAIITTEQSSDERQELSLDGTRSSDTEGDITYAWSAEETDKAFLIITNATAVTATLSIGEVMETSPVTITLKVTDSAGQFSTAEHTLTLNEIDEALLPPDPGSASTETFEGVDVNNNSVRDDMEIAIYKLHKDNYEYRQVQMLGAQAYGVLLKAGHSGNQEDDANADELIGKYIGCLVEHYPDLRKEGGRTIVKSLMINTPERVEANFARNAAAGGTVGSAPPSYKKEECLMFSQEGV